MSLSAPSSPVYRTSCEQKRQSREAARKRCNTPKVLRDMLREKCRIRLHEARHCNYQKSRNLLESFTVEEILRQELAELEKDVELQAKIYEELKAESNDWFAEQIEEEQNYLIEVGESDELICPVCQKATMEFEKQNNLYKCFCGTSFLYPGSSNKLHNALQIRVNEHGQCCEENLMFFVEPFHYGSGNDMNILSAMCDGCDYFVSF